MTHPLEKELNAPAQDILDAIQYGFRAQVDVKGKLAELYLYRKLKTLESEGKISKVEWTDVDGEPDFKINYKGKIIKVECKNVRNETYKKPIPSYKVEIQKTRNSKDGTNTRSYKKDYFDIIAACTFNQTKKWEFVYIKSSDLETVESGSNLLKIMHKVPIIVVNPWEKDIMKLLN
jgi:hypothetical protein